MSTYRVQRQSQVERLSTKRVTQSSTRQPLGPFQFCSVLQVPIDKLEVPDLALKNNWFMNDWSLFGKSDDVLRAWNIAKAECRFLLTF